MALLAGCVNPLSSSTFLPGSETAIDDGETHLLFDAPDGTEILTAALLYHEARAAKRDGNPLPLAVSINPHEPTRLDRLRLEFRSPPKVSSTKLPATVHLEAPQATDFPSLRYRSDPTQRLATFVEVPEFGSEHRGTSLSFRFLVQPRVEEATTRIRVAVNAALSEPGILSKERYDALGGATIEISGS